MLFIENYAMVPYSGTIQMVPGSSGFVPAHQGRDSDGMGLSSQAFRESRYRQTGLLDEAHETTYNKDRRLASFGMSDVGAFIDTYA